MASLISTGQLDLGSLKEFLLRPNSESLSGSANNITGFYPYSGNPSGFVDSSYVTSISGDISGYIDSVSGAINSRLIESGTNLSGYASAIETRLKSDITFLSGKNLELSGTYSSSNTVALQNQQDISSLSGKLVESGENLSLLITGSEAGLSGFVTGYVATTSGALNTKVTNLNTSLRSHVNEDYLSKRNESELVSGSVSFAKTTRFKQSIELERVADHDEVSNYQSGVNMYSMVSGVTVSGAAHQVMTTYLRYPHTGDSANQNLIVGSYMYSGVIP
tara:strand:+ start:537 stop:1367 length:831 start_codon:yes stop_codon:yes gene_type:complete